MANGGSVVTCPGCGAKVAAPAPGTAPRCDYCGTPLPAPAGFAPPAPGGFAPSPAFGAPPSYGPVPGFQPPQYVPPPYAVRKRRSPVRWIVTSLFVLAAAGGIGWFVWRMAWSKIDGTVQSSGGPLGSWTASLDTCRSGAAFTPGFFGADLTASSPKAHVQVQAAGPGGKTTVVVGGPAGDEPHEDLTRETCRVFDVAVDWGNAEVNDVKTVGGHVHIDCATADGGHVRVDARFDACH